ncbi:hypothetical protein JCM10135_12540 [Stetteria hydrogenophila]
MPALSRLIRESILKKPILCFPPVTIPSWQVIYTGKYIDEIGIYDFFKVKKVGNNFKMQMVTSNDVEAPYHWEVGRRLKNEVHLVIGAPLSYPPRIPRDDLIVTGDWLYPSKPLFNKTDIKIKPIEFRSQFYLHNLNVDKYIEASLREINQIQETIEKTLNAKSGIYLYTVLPYTDNIMHIWPQRFIKGEFKDIAKRLDELVSFILENFDLVILVSDHDFKPYNVLLNVKYVLVKKGFLRFWHENKIIYNYINYKFPSISYGEHIWKLMLKMLSISRKMKPVKSLYDAPRPKFSSEYENESVVIPAKYPYIIKVISESVVKDVFNTLKKEYEFLLINGLIDISYNNNFIFINVKDENIGMVPGYIPVKKSLIKLNTAIYDHGLYGFTALYASRKDFQLPYHEIDANIHVGKLIGQLVGTDKRYLLSWRTRQALKLKKAG